MKLRIANVFAVICSAMLAVQCVGVDPLPPRVNYPDIDEDGETDGNVEFVEAPDDPSDDLTGSWNYAALKTMGHPRLFMSQADFEDLKTKVSEGRTENIFLYRIHNAIISRADELLAKPDDISETLDASGRRLLPMSKKTLDGIWHHSYAYRMSGDRKYLAAAKKILANVCGFSYWTNRENPHYLDVAEMTLAVAIAYDWLYYDLTLEERTKAHQCIRDFAFDTYKTNGFQKDNATASTSNWNQVCFCGLGCAAIALYEKDKQRCFDLLERLIPSNKRALEHIYKPNGVYPEGYTYWSYGTGMQTVLLTALEHAFGTTNGLEDVEGFMKTGDYMLFMNGPAGQVFSYSDCTADGEYGKVAMWYFAAKQNDLSLLANEVRLFNKLSKYPGDQFSRILPVIPAMTKNVTLGDLSQTMPAKEIFVSNNEDEPLHLMMIHTGWKFNADDKYVGFKGGSPSYSHGHMDVGSFVYDAFGQRWSHDLGMETYTTMESNLGIADAWSLKSGSPRWTVFRLGNKGHSTLLINGAEQNVAGRGVITAFEDNATAKGATMDLTSIYSAEVKSVSRQIRLYGNELIITDVIETLPDKAADVQWRMLTPANVFMEQSLKRERMVSGGKTLYLRADASDSNISPVYTTWNASGEYSWEKSNKGMTVAGYTCTIPKGRKVTLTTKLTPNE